MSSRFCIRSLVLLALTAIAPAAFPAYPDKPVKVVVGYAPGGSTDIVARLLATALSAKWGQTVIVENKAGASGMIGAEQVVRAAPDGYTLLLGYTPEVSLNKLVFKEIRYDPITDLTPLALAASAPLVLVSGPKLPVSNIRELLARKGSSQVISYGSPGIGGQQHMAGEMLGRLTGMSLTHVPYRGTSLAVTDLVGGQIDLFFGTTPPLLQHIRSGKLRPIAIAGPTREKLLPDVPTVVELGLPGLQLTNWFGVFGPKALPASLASKISNDVIEILGEKSFTRAIEDQGLTATPLQGTPLREFIDAEMKKYQTIVTQTGISAQ